jgi:hypothetical protein
MIDITRIIDDLEQLKKYPNMYLQPVNAETLVSFLIGLERGVFLLSESVMFNDFADARREVNKNKGWESRGVSVYSEMRLKNIPEKDIIQEIITIDIEKWKLLQEWSIKNELTPKT